MRIHQNKHHYRTFQKNPFLGAGTRVFMAIEDDARLLEDRHLSWSTAQTTEQPLAKAIREQMERRRTERLSENGEPYRAELNTENYQEWQSSLASLQAVHAYKAWIEKQMKCIEDPSSCDLKDESGFSRPFDLRDSAWHMRVYNIYKVYADGDAHIATLGSIGDGYRQALSLNLAGEVGKAKEQIIKDCQKMVEQTQIAGVQVENEIKKQMREDFTARLLWLRQQWEQNPPRDYAAKPDVIDSQLQFIDKARTAIEGMVGNSTPFKEYQAIWGDLDQIENLYKAGKRADAYLDEHIEELSQKGLEAKLKSVEEKRKTVVSAHEAEHAQQMAKALEAMRGYYSSVAALPEEAQRFTIQKRKVLGADGVQKEEKVIPCQPNDKGEYEEGTKGYVLAQIQKRIAELEQYGSLEAATHAVLYDPDKKRGTKKVKIPSGDGEREIEVPNSLEGQIQFVFDPNNGLTEPERRAIAMGIYEAIGNFEKRIEDPQMLMGNLGQIQEQCVQHMSNIQSQEMKISAENADRGYSVYWVAPYDAVRAWEIVTGWWDRTYQRRVNKRLSKLGSDALKPLGTGPITILRTLPNEFNKQGEDAERNEVQQFQDAYGNKDYWQIEEIAVETQNQDELKACLNLLSGAGRLRWDNPKLIRQFNRFQSVFHISENMGVHYVNPSQFYEQLDRACGYIWDNDTFKGWERANSGNYNSKGKDYDSKLTAASETGGGIGAMMDSMLSEWKLKGKGAKFDPLLYDRAIGYSIEQGKMGSEEKLYYLIQGIAYDIIPFERGSHYTSLNNIYPAIEFFARGSDHETLGYKGKVSMSLVRKVAEMDKDSFVDWWHYYVMNLPMVRQRLDKAITGGGKMDHDDLTPFFPYMGVKTIEQCITGNATGGFTVPQTGLENATVGMEFYMRNFAEHRLHGDEIDHQMVDLKQFGEFAQTFVFFNGAVRNRLYKGRNNIFRFNNDVMDKVPRSGGSYKGLYGYGKQTVRKNLDNVEQWMTRLEPDFFGALFNDNFRDSDVPKLSLFLQKKYGTDERNLFGTSPITKVDELHLATSNFVNFLISRDPNAVRSMLEAVNAENEKGTQTFDLRRKREAFKRVLREQSPPPQFAHWVNEVVQDDSYLN